MSFLEQAQQLKETLVKNRRYLHQHAELGFDLPMTREYVKQQLSAMGYEYEEVGGGIVALAGGKKSGKVFMIRADMDSLPIVEKRESEFKSETGNMHACGHDFHTAMLLGAAQILKNNEDEINGTVKLMFQPAEEILSGAKSMIDAGVMENPKVDAAAMIHVVSGTDLPAGCVLLPNPGAGSSAADWVDITITGVGAHGAMPQNSVDPINVASHLHTALQEILAREISPSAAASFTIGVLNSGSAGNVLPDKATMTGTMRTLDEDVRAFMKKRIEEMSDHIAKAFRATAEVRFYNGCPVFVSEEKICEDVADSVRSVIGADRAILPPKSTALGGSEDFAYVAQLVPATSVMLSTGSIKEGNVNPLHHPDVTFNEDALPVGAAIYATIALDWLNKNQ